MRLCPEFFSHNTRFATGADEATLRIYLNKYQLFSVDLTFMPQCVEIRFQTDYFDVVAFNTSSGVPHYKYTGTNMFQFMYDTKSLSALEYIIVGSTYATFCSVACDSAKMCSNHGTCSSFGCKCDADYYGSDCSKKCNCVNGGICTQDGCVCPAGTNGRACECSDIASCSGKGTCNSNGECECKKHFVGQSCNCYRALNSSVACDASVDCSGHGVCDKDNSCICKESWLGCDCSIRM